MVMEMTIDERINAMYDLLDKNGSPNDRGNWSHIVAFIRDAQKREKTQSKCRCGEKIAYKLCQKCFDKHFI